MTNGVLLAGWSTRAFTVDDMVDYLKRHSPSTVEISKDLLSRLSIKELHRALNEHRRRCATVISFAGTTDLTTCASIPWAAYKDYLGIQIAQARFLESGYFRLFVGVDHAFSESELVTRLEEVRLLLAPMIPAIEIHGGWESKEAARLRLLVAKTSVRIVVDFANGLSSGLRFSDLCDIIPADRIVYFHSRNLGDSYIEDAETVKEERRWRGVCPDTPVLWEPKKLTPQRIKGIADGMEVAH